MQHIVKRRGHKEQFDERKIYASCYAACMSAQIEHHKAEKICDKVSKEVKAWMQTKKQVSSTQIFKHAAQIIKKYHQEAAFMYETHRDIS